jgi:serine/threonine protein kinase
MHQMGYSHRDVKPHNMLLSGAPDEWTTVLMDLGSVSLAAVDVRTKGEALSLQEEAACKTSAAYRSPG